MRKQTVLEAAWHVIQDNARGSISKQVRQEVNDFAVTPGRRIRSIQHRLARGNFEFAAAKGIVNVKKDHRGRKTKKVRPIVLAPLESRIVQRALLDVLVGLPTIAMYANTPFSFGGVRSSNGAREKPLSGVPAAIAALLKSIEGGATYYASADIKGFFTRIPKSHILEVIRAAVRDDEFCDFLGKAISVELTNMSQLREHVSAFPIEDIGVAQGNSLSSLLGNITLNKFDLEMNKSDGQCMRYADDFIILGRSQKAVNSQLRKAVRLLNELGMELSPEKSSKGACPVAEGLSFLGIQIIPGLIRPTDKKRQSIMTTIEIEFRASQQAITQTLKGKALPRQHTLISTLKRVDSIIDSWGKSYRFCNDAEFFRRVDEQIRIKTREFLGVYRSVRAKLDDPERDHLLGITKLSDQSRSPFSYPTSRIIK